MRIAVVAPPWLPVPPPAYGGTERVLDDLCRSLSAAGHDVLLCASGDSTCPVERRSTFATACRTDGATPVAELSHVIGSYEQLRQWGADVVHDHTLVGPFYAERFPHLNVITTNHGPFESDLGPVYRALAARVPLIAISHHQASRARDTPIEAVIHHGIDCGQFPVGAGDGGYVLFLGRMCPEKGVAAAARVARQAGVPLKIAAKLCEPAEFEYFKTEVEPLLGDDIEYVGEVGGTEKLDLLGGARCLINPIAWPEPFGMVMIEALACGTPVVSTPCGAAPELLENGRTGFLCTDESGLADAISRVDELDRDECRRVAESRFSSQRMAAEHVIVYKRLLSRHEPVPLGNRSVRHLEPVARRSTSA